MAAVTSVGTPTLTRAASGSVTGTWGTGQNRSAGNMLIAAVSCAAATSITAPSTPAGWTKAVTATAGSKCASVIYTKIAAGADAAPNFTSTLTGAGAMTATLYELSGDVGPVSLQTSGTGTGTTTTALNATTAAPVLLSGEFAVQVTCQVLSAAATTTVTPLSGWADDGDDTATSDIIHTAITSEANPPYGSTLGAQVTWGSAGTNISTVLAVLQVPLQAIPLPLQPGNAPAMYSRFGPAKPFATHAEIERPPGPPFTVVQTAGPVQVQSLTGPLTVTLGANTTAGNTLVAVITTSGSTGNPQVSSITLGGVADNWQAATTDGPNSGLGGAIWYDPACAGGQTSVVLTCSGGSGVNGDIYLTVYEVAGVLAFDQASHGDASAATTWSSGTTPTVSQSNEIAFAGCTATSAIPTVTGSGTWTTVSTGLGQYDQIAGYQQTSTGGTFTFSGTIPSGTYTAIVASFAASGSATTASAGAATVTAAANAPVPQVTASAGAATVTAQGNAPVPQVLPAAGQAVVTATGNAPAITISPAAGAATVTATGDTATVTVSAAAGGATVSGTAGPPVPTVIPAAGAATSTATASQPVAGATVPAGLATVTAEATYFTYPAAATVSATANAPVPVVTASAGAATVNATASAPVPMVAAAPAAATVTATGNAPVPGVTVAAGAATVNASANQPAVSTSGNTTANAGAATVTAGAGQPTATVAPAAGPAISTAAAPAATPAAGASAGAATGTATAGQPAAAVTAKAGAATVAATASPASLAVTVAAPAATAAATVAALTAAAAAQAQAALTAAIASDAVAQQVGIPGTVTAFDRAAFTAAAADRAAFTVAAADWQVPAAGGYGAAYTATYQGAAGTFTGPGVVATDRPAGTVGAFDRPAGTVTAADFVP